MSDFILVTGGTGFIGSHTCVSLIEKGYRILIVDSLINSSEKVIDRITKTANPKIKKFCKNIEFIVIFIHSLTPAVFFFKPRF